MLPETEPAEIDQLTPPGDERSSAAAPRRPEHWVILTAALLGVLGLIAVRFVLEPDARGFGTHEQLGLQPCFPMEVWDFPCPGCGVTTSVTHAVHGEWLSALVAQPLGLALVFVAVWFAGWALLAHVRGRDLWVELNAWNWSRWGSVALLFVVLSWAYKLAKVRGVV